MYNHEENSINEMNFLNFDLEMCNHEEKKTQ